jgi:hypothetical protein
MCNPIEDRDQKKDKEESRSEVPVVKMKPFGPVLEEGFVE